MPPILFIQSIIPRILLVHNNILRIGNQIWVPIAKRIEGIVMATKEDRYRGVGFGNEPNMKETHNVLI